MQARLKVLHDKANVKQVKLLPVTLIGRSTDCNLKIASSQVSRNHCRITVGSDTVYVEDLGSANGTLVDGQLIPAHQPTAIAPGAHLVVGPAEFQIDYVAATTATVVLPRSGVPIAPSLSSTEMIFPKPPAEAVADVVAAERAAEPEPIAAIASAVAISATSEAQAAPVESLIAAEVQAGSPAAEFGNDDFVPNVEDGLEGVESEAGAFDFLEAGAIAESEPETPSSTDPVSPVAEKKGPLKGLFSLFNRKSKSAGSATEPAPAPVAEPSVFLPTVDAQIAANTEVSDEAPSPGIEAAIETIAFDVDPTGDTTEENQGFQQFLAQFSEEEPA